MSQSFIFGLIIYIFGTTVNQRSLSGGGRQSQTFIKLLNPRIVEIKTRFGTPNGSLMKPSGRIFNFEGTKYGGIKLFVNCNTLR